MQITNPAENFDVSALKLDAPTIDYSNIYEAHVTAAIDRMSSFFTTGRFFLCKEALAKPLRALFQCFLTQEKRPKKN